MQAELVIADAVDAGSWGLNVKDRVAVQDSQGTAVAVGLIAALPGMLWPPGRWQGRTDVLPGPKLGHEYAAVCSLQIIHGREEEAATVKPALRDFPIFGVYKTRNLLDHKRFWLKSTSDSSKPDSPLDIGMIFKTASLRRLDRPQQASRNGH